MHSARPIAVLNAQKKHTAFSNQVSMCTIQSQSSVEQLDSHTDESATRDLETSHERFDIVKEWLSRGYQNRELQQPFTKPGMIDFYSSHITPLSPTRVNLRGYLEAQGTSAKT